MTALENIMTQSDTLTDKKNESGFQAQGLFCTRQTKK